MNWFRKLSANNSITILFYAPGGFIKVLSGAGIEYIYYGVTPGQISQLQRLIKQKRFGEGRKLLKTLENDSYTSRLTPRSE